MINKNKKWKVLGYGKHLNFLSSEARAGMLPQTKGNNLLPFFI